MYIIPEFTKSGNFTKPLYIIVWSYPSASPNSLTWTLVCPLKYSAKDRLLKNTSCNRSSRCITHWDNTKNIRGQKIKWMLHLYCACFGQWLTKSAAMLSAYSCRTDVTSVCMRLDTITSLPNRPPSHTRLWLDATCTLSRSVSATMHKASATGSSRAGCYTNAQEQHFSYVGQPDS